MEILVTNDDGINSPAINKLAEVLKQYGNVTVVAPDRDQSGKGPSKFSRMWRYYKMFILECFCG